MAERGAKSLELGDVIGTTFRVWVKNLVPFTIISLIVYSPLFLVTLITRDDPNSMLARFSNLIQQALGFVAAGAFTYGVVQSLRGKTVAAGECMSAGFARLLPVLGVSLLVFLCVLGGFLLLVIPGIILSCMLAVAVPVAVIEKPGVMASLKRSAELTKGYKVSIFVIYLVLGILAFAIGFVVALVFAAMGTLGALLATAAVLVVAGALQAALPAVIYQRLRDIREGTSVEDLAKVFD